MLSLRSYTNPFPPGGFDYRQTEGIDYYFEPQGGMKSLTTRVHDFRVANHLPRSQWESCFRDIEIYMIARLGADSQWVVDTEASQYVAPVRSSRSGGCCGARIA